MLMHLKTRQPSSSESDPRTSAGTTSKQESIHVRNEGAADGAVSERGRRSVRLDPRVSLRIHPASRADLHRGGPRADRAHLHRDRGAAATALRHRRAGPRQHLHHHTGDHGHLRGAHHLSGRGHAPGLISTHGTD